MSTEITSAIIGAIAGSITTFILSTFSNRRKEKRDDQRALKEKSEMAFIDRPEFSISSYKDYSSRPGYGTKQACDINVLVAHIESTIVNGDVVDAIYRKEDFNPDAWCCVIYTLKNAGKTDISNLYIISTHKRDTVIFPLDSAQKFASHAVLNYSECYDKKIRTGESITIKICYNKDRIISGLFSASLCIAMEDSNGRHWFQPLWAPDNKVYDSHQTTYKEYREALLPHAAEECFKKPWLW